MTSSWSATVPPPSALRGLLGQLEVEVAEGDAAALADQRPWRWPCPIPLAPPVMATTLPVSERGSLAIR